MILAKIFKKKRHPAARPAYEAIVAAARQPVFYADLAVPDTVDGRFDMIALHSFLVMNRLKKAVLEGAGTEGFVQALVDEVFRDMDRSLREMGVGDLSVGKRVRKMAEVFYGRAEAYRAALGEPLSERQLALEDTVNRNIFAGHDSPCAKFIGLYILKASDHLERISIDDIMSGDLSFPYPLQ
jgi:cytochrome b pre-mRNA-processing protein 3